jgi:hypothetical protein
MNWFRDTSTDRKWIREEIGAIKWDRQFRARFFVGGKDDTERRRGEQLGRIRRLLNLVRLRERE